jgi:TusA-related sulfurtransferase
MERSVVTQGGFDSEAIAADAVADITAELCPMTFVRTRLALDRLESGKVLRVVLRGEEPQRNIPRGALELGHEVIGICAGADGTVSVFIRKR